MKRFLILLLSLAGAFAPAADLTPEASRVTTSGRTPTDSDKTWWQNRIGLPKIAVTDATNTKRACFWGHSFWGSSGESDPTEQLWKNFGYVVYNGGVGGETSAQIRARFDVADPALYKWPTYFYVGRNNLADLTQVMSDLTHMVQVLEAAGNYNYIIFADSTRDDPTERPGTTIYGQAIALRDAMQAFRPNNFFDAWHWGVNLADPSIPQDVIDKANDVWPARLRRDNLHANLAMNILLAAQVQQLTATRFDISRGTLPGWSMASMLQQLNPQGIEIFQNSRGLIDGSKLTMRWQSDGRAVIGTEFGTGGGSKSIAIGCATIANSQPEVGMYQLIGSISPYFRWEMGTVGAAGVRSQVRGTISGTNSGQHFAILPTYTQTGAAAATDLLVNRTETTVGSGAQLLMDLQVGGISKFKVSTAGKLTVTLSVFADNAAALAGGLTAGDVYRTATGEIRVAY